MVRRRGAGVLRREFFGGGDVGRGFRGGRGASGRRGEGGVGAMMLGAVNEALGNTSLVIPLNVDGVKLGEACIRAMDRVSGMTGRAHIAI